MRRTGVDCYNEIRGAPRDMAWLCRCQSLETLLEKAGSPTVPADDIVSDCALALFLVPFPLVLPASAFHHPVINQENVNITRLPFYRTESRHGDDLLPLGQLPGRLMPRMG